MTDHRYWTECRREALIAHAPGWVRAQHDGWCCRCGMAYEAGQAIRAEWEPGSIRAECCAEVGIPHLPRSVVE